MAKGGMPPMIDSFSAIAPRFSGGISVIASSAILWIIFRSDTKLSTIYHRIMFGMSFVDILGSTAMGLSTLPMPKERNIEEDVYSRFPWEGTMLGNETTCALQGFFFTFGISTMFAYNAMLCFYYALAIAFRMKEGKITKYFEIFFHGFPLCFGLGGAIPPFFLGWYQRTAWEAWCTIVIKREIQEILSILTFSFILTLMGLTLIFLSLIIWRVVSTEIAMTQTIYSKKGVEKQLLRRSQQIQRTEKTHQNTKVILIQALAYIFSFMLTLLMPFLRGVISGEANWVVRLQIILLPLQGLFNALIFISHKVYNYRRVHDEVSTCQVLQLLFKGSANDDLLLSRISLLQIDEVENVVNVEITNEREVAQFRISLDDFEDNERNDMSVFIDTDESRDEMNSEGINSLNEKQTFGGPSSGENSLNHDLSLSTPSHQGNDSNLSSIPENSLGGFSLSTPSQGIDSNLSRGENTRGSLISSWGSRFSVSRQGSVKSKSSNDNDRLPDV